ncbi:MAG: polysaccharide pyruvyl transferase family protein [Kiritimatiellales bacterium]
MNKVSIKQHVLDHLCLIRDVIFTLRPRAYIAAAPTHANLGDQAQLMCLELWIQKNYPEHKLVRIPISLLAAHVVLVSGYFLAAVRCMLVIGTLRVFSRGKDIIFGHSGYFFIDHHSGWYSFARLAGALPKTRLVIMPQTVNFMNPVIRNTAAQIFDGHPDTTIICRDETSLEKAREMFSRCRLLLCPDIVTTLIGSERNRPEKRSGILFCMRSDVESFYAREKMEDMAARLAIPRTEFSDTTIAADAWTVRNEKERLINEYLDYAASFAVVVTDRYHGAIFSLIAETPVVVIDSADHKLRSGVAWYPAEIFGRNIVFAGSLEEAEKKVKAFLADTERREALPPYFKEKYYEHLKARL